MRIKNFFAKTIIALALYGSEQAVAQVPRTDGERIVKNRLENLIGGTTIQGPIYFGDNEFLFAAYTNSSLADSSFVEDIDQVAFDYLATNEDSPENRFDLKTDTYGLRYFNISEQSDSSSLVSVVDGLVNTFLFGMLGVDDDIILGIPEDFKLGDNYPNPFNPLTTIEYSLNKNSNVKFEVYNLLGEVVEERVYENQTPGTHKINFDGSNFGSQPFFYSIIVRKQRETKKMTLLK